MKICRICNENKVITDYYKQDKFSKEKGNYIYYNPECKKCAKKRAMEWKLSNPEKRKVNDKKDNDRPEKRLLMEKLNKINRDNGLYRKWQRDNKDKIQVYNKNRQQHKMHNITVVEWESCKEYFNNECAYCGIHISEHFNKYGDNLKWTDFHKEHVDHEGGNVLTNCIPSCKSCNSSKHTSILEEWYTPNNPNYNEVRLSRIYKWLYEDVYNSDVV